MVAWPGWNSRNASPVFDESKRFNPKYDESVTKIVDADRVLLSIGQSIDWGNLTAGSKVELNRNNTVKADPFTYQTAEPDVFAGGGRSHGAQVRHRRHRRGQAGRDLDPSFRPAGAEPGNRPR